MSSNDTFICKPMSMVQLYTLRELTIQGSGIVFQQMALFTSSPAPIWLETESMKANEQLNEEVVRFFTKHLSQTFIYIICSLAPKWNQWWQLKACHCHCLTDDEQKSSFAENVFNG